MLLILNSTGYTCYHSLIVGHLFSFFLIICTCSYAVSVTHYLCISGLASSGIRFQPTTPTMLKTFRLIRVELLWWYRMTLSPTRNYTNCTFPRLTLHACTLIRTISLSYCGISLSFHAISLSYALFHFPRAVSIEQLFSPYIFEWAIYTPYYYIQKFLICYLQKTL